MMKVTGACMICVGEGRKFVGERIDLKRCWMEGELERSDVPIVSSVFDLVVGKGIGFVVRGLNGGGGRGFISIDGLGFCKIFIDKSRIRGEKRERERRRDRIMIKEIPTCCLAGTSVVGRGEGRLTLAFPTTTKDGFNE